MSIGGGVRTGERGGMKAIGGLFIGGLVKETSVISSILLFVTLFVVNIVRSKEIIRSLSDFSEQGVIVQNYWQHLHK